MFNSLKLKETDKEAKEYFVSLTGMINDMLQIVPRIWLNLFYFFHYLQHYYSRDFHFLHLNLIIKYEKI